MAPRDKYDPLCYSVSAFISELFPPLAAGTLDSSEGMIGTYEGIPFMAVPEVRKVYFNNKHTTIEWADGLKTTVGCIDGQEFDEYGGFAAAVLKRMFGSSKAAVRYMDERKVVQPESIKKVKKTDETAVQQDA